jgi:hypothetical protein
MQTLVQVLSSHRRSLRDLIVNDRRLSKFHLAVVTEKKPGRPHGWAKLHSLDKNGQGAINMEWHPATKMLICRVVTKGSGRPNIVIGDFVDYLLACHRTKIEMIGISPR